jgi:hypothetical protein
MDIKRMKEINKGITTLKVVIDDYEKEWLRKSSVCEHIGLSFYCAHLGRDYDPVCDHMDCPLLRE